MNQIAVKKRTSKSSNKLIILLLIVIIAGGAVFYHSQNKSGIQYDENASMGVLPGVDLEKRKEELQKQLDENMIAFSVNTSPVFVSGTEKGNLMIENPEHNAKLLVAEIYTNDTNELIYQSKAIKPGSYIESAKLDKVLNKGTYEATIYFKAYNLKTNDYIGQTGAEITITVQS